MGDIKMGLFSWKKRLETEEKIEKDIYPREIKKMLNTYFATKRPGFIVNNVEITQKADYNHLTISGNFVSGNDRQTTIMTLQGDDIKEIYSFVNPRNRIMDLDILKDRITISARKEVAREVMFKDFIKNNDEVI